MIQYSASTFFSIDNFEKESGLLTLTFGSSNPSQFITGGHWEATAINEHFSGDYVDFIDKYYKAELLGKINIVVTSIDETKTKVTVNVKYVFIATVYIGNKPDSDTYSFTSGNCATIAVKKPISGTPPTRTICPTYKAENAILKAIDSF